MYDETNEVINTEETYEEPSVPAEVEVVGDAENKAKAPSKGKSWLGAMVDTIADDGPVVAGCALVAIGVHEGVQLAKPLISKGLTWLKDKRETRKAVKAELKKAKETPKQEQKEEPEKVSGTVETTSEETQKK